MAIAGKKARVQVSTNDSTYNNVAGIDNAQMSLGGENVDISEFGVDWVQRLQGVKDNTFQLSGSYTPTDTNGQVVIRDAFLNDTTLYAKFLVDGVVGFKQQVKVASFEVSAQHKGKVEVNIQLEGTGPVTAV